MYIHCRWVAVVALMAGIGLGWAADQEKPVKLSKEEQYLVDLANQVRREKNLPALKVHPLLNKAAYGYSQVLIKHADKAHQMMVKKDPKVHEIEGISVAKRFDAVGYDYTEYGENVAVTHTLELMTRMKTIHEIWMASKVHRDNILDDKFAEIGIAIVKNPDRDQWFITQVFGTR